LNTRLAFFDLAIAIGDLIRLPIGRIAGFDESAPIQGRYRPILGFRSAAAINVWVLSANAPAIGRTLNVFVCDSKTTTDLSESFLQIAGASWEDQKPSPGLYLSWNSKLRTLTDRQLADLTFVSDYTIERAVRGPEMLMEADSAVGSIGLPDHRQNSSELNFAAAPATISAC
jgi:hypothetical protein